MKISISISSEEVTKLSKSLGIDPIKLLDTLSRFGVTEESITTDSDVPNNYSAEILNEWFEKISWQTFYFSHLIIVHSKALNQHDAFGYYLDSSQLSEFKISERSASSRVGGSRRVCKAINSIDILFIRTQRKERKKLFYVNLDAVDDLMRIVDERNEDYREELEDLELEYPVDRE
ncbi:MAG: hypothetical protein U9R66_06310 [Thermodesulfobacteriota bacterium]|nr:hypothetical protein [Thermodesulfobacteriota bacterium]